MKRIISALTILIVGISLVYALPAKAAALIGVTNTLTSDVASVTTTHTVAFTTVGALAVALPADQIIITFPAGFNAIGAAVDAATTTPSTTDPTLASATATVVTLDVAADEAAGAFSIVLTNVVNSPTANNNYVVSVETQDGAAGNIDGPTNSAAFTINPAPLTDLACVATGQAGIVMLSWTVPAGTSNGYEVVYSLAVINNIATYNAATPFVNTWLSGTVGNNSWNLVTGLSPNTTHWFAMKAKGANATISAIPTNLGVNGISCQAPISGSSVYADSTPPTSTITAPIHGSTILAGQSYTIKGTALDTGGSSVQKVEVSLDGGDTWYAATIESVVDNNSLWEYIWQNPTVGDYTIQTKATDWMGNLEIPGTGITVTVATTLPTPTQPTTPTTPTTPTIEKPISQMTAVEIQAKIVEVQQTIINLLQQLIQTIQQQIQVLLSQSHS